MELRCDLSAMILLFLFLLFALLVMIVVRSCTIIIIIISRSRSSSTTGRSIIRKEDKLLAIGFVVVLPIFELACFATIRGSTSLTYFELFRSGFIVFA